MSLSLKDAVTKMKATPNKVYHFFYCEADEAGKTHLSFDEKKVPNGSEVLSKAQKKVKCTGEMKITDDHTLVVTPIGSAPAGMATKIKVALTEAKAMSGINGVTIEKGKSEAPETSEQEGEEEKQKPAPGAKPIPKDEGDFQGRLKDFVPKLTKAIAQSPHGRTLQAAWDRVKRAWENKQFKIANDLLNEFEPHVERALQAPPAPKKERKLVPEGEVQYRKIMGFCEGSYKRIIEHALVADGEFAREIKHAWTTAQEVAAKKDYRLAGDILEPVLPKCAHLLEFQQRAEALLDPATRQFMEKRYRAANEQLEELLRDVDRMDNPDKKGYRNLFELEALAAGRGGGEFRESDVALPKRERPWEKEPSDEDPVSQRGSPPPDRAGPATAYAAKLVPWVKTKMAACAQAAAIPCDDYQANVNRQRLGAMLKEVQELAKRLTAAHAMLGRAITDQAKERAVYEAALGVCQAKLQQLESNTDPNNADRLCTELEEAAEALAEAADTMEQTLRQPAVAQAIKQMRVVVGPLKEYSDR